MFLDLRSLAKLKAVKPKHLPKGALFLILAACVAPLQFAHAYVDPGTGSYILQITIGVIAGVAFAIKSFWGSIVSTIKGKRGAKKEVKETKKEEKSD